MKAVKLFLFILLLGITKFSTAQNCPLLSDLINYSETNWTNCKLTLKQKADSTVWVDNMYSFWIWNQATMRYYIILTASDEAKRVIDLQTDDKQCFDDLMLEINKGYGYSNTTPGLSDIESNRKFYKNSVRRIAVFTSTLNGNVHYTVRIYPN